MTGNQWFLYPLGTRIFETALLQPSTSACSSALQQLLALLLRVDRRVFTPYGRRLQKLLRSSQPRGPCRPAARPLLSSALPGPAYGQAHNSGTPKSPQLSGCQAWQHRTQGFILTQTPLRETPVTGAGRCRSATDKLFRIDPRESH